MILLQGRKVININIVKSREEMKLGKSIYDMNLRVVYYARVSTESDEQLNSLDNQQKFFEDYINNSKSWKLVGKYIDEGISATGVDKRKSFLRMIEDAVNGKFDMIITKEVSRFARNTIDSIKYTDYLLKNGVIVNFLNDNLNTLDETCEFRLTIMSSLAQDEVRKLSSRVKFGLQRSVKDGKVLGGGNITGYYKEKGKLYIDEDEAPMIRMLFSLYATGKYGFRTIAQKLYESGYRNTKGKPYADRVLRRMLNNPKYKGYYCGNISYIEDYKTHKKIYRPKSEWIVYKDENIPPIVSEELWDRANEIFNAKSEGYSYRKGQKNVYDNKYTYTSKLVCSEHKCNFSRHGWGRRYDNPVWQCLEYHRGGLKACNTPTLYEKHLDIIFKKILGEFIKHKDKLLNEMLEDYKKALKKNNEENKLLELYEKNRKIENLKNKLLELSLDGCISNLEFKEKNDNYNKEIEQNKILIKELEVLNKQEDRNIKQLNRIKKALKEKIDVDKNFKTFFNLLVKKVIVSKIDGNRKHIKLDIIFNFNTSNISVEYDSSKNFDFKLHHLDTQGTGG